jgi:hypothetical protein
LSEEFLFSIDVLTKSMIIWKLTVSSFYQSHKKKRV